MQRYIVSSIEFIGHKVYYINDTLVADEEPYDLVCETESKPYATMICDLLNKETENHA